MVKPVSKACASFISEIMPFLVEKRLKQDLERAAEFVDANPGNIDCILKTIPNTEQPIRDRLAWVLQIAVEKWPDVLSEDHLHALTEIFATSKTDAELRAFLNILRTRPIPEELQAELFDKASDWAINPKKSIAIRVYSIYLLGKIVEVQPDLRNETLLALDAIAQGESTPALFVAIRNVRKDLKR